MRLNLKKTFSQQQLAIKLRVAPHGSTGILSWKRWRMVADAAKTALAAALCWWIAMLLGLHDGYWGSISAIVVLQSNVGATVTASRDRLLGTLIGAAFGFAFALVHPLVVGYVLAVVTAVVVCNLLGMRNSGRLAGVTVSIVMLVHREGSRWGLALDRVGEVLLGIVVALIVATLVFPDRARLRLRDGLAQEFLLLGSFFEAILQGYRGALAQNLPKLREDIEAMLDGNDKLLDASRNEPSGPGWREGLSILAHFGRDLFDSLLALELSVVDSRDDDYARHFERELQRLAADIGAVFQHVAACTHKWRFRSSAEGISLEQDIADLESRMDAVRHTGISFAQPEVLRAYAVQLHLKQIARLLRAARMETSRAVGETHKIIAPA